MIQDANVLDLLVQPLENNQTWVDAVEAFAQVLEMYVEDPINQLEEIRYLVHNEKGTILANTARMLGFDISQDVLNLNSSNLTKLVTQLPLYPDQNGTELFNKFLDLVLNSYSTIEYLYTKDYLNFYTKEWLDINKQGWLMLEDGGKYFKTTHINVNLELIAEQLTQLSGKVYDRIIEIFYNFSPAALVIKHFYFIVIFKDDDYPGGKAFGIGALLPPNELTIIIE